MALSAYTEVLAEGDYASDETETFDLVTRGRQGLIVISNVSNADAGAAYIDTADLDGDLPITVALGVNDTFTFDGDAYTIAPGTYTTLALFAAAINAALFVLARFDAEVEATVVDDHLRLTSQTPGADVREFGVGDDDALETTMGLSDTDPLAHGAADGSFSLTVTVQGVDTVSGSTWDILVGAALTSEDTLNVLRVHPDIVAANNIKAKDVLPGTVRIKVEHTTTAAITRSYVAQLV